MPVLLVIRSFLKGGALFDGEATLVIEGDGDAFNLICNGTNWAIY